MADIRPLSSSELAKFTSKISTHATKELVQKGAKGEGDFPEELANYKWSNTLDFNMAAIITSIFAYIGKSCDELKADAKAIVSKVGQALVDGVGGDIKSEFETPHGKKILDELFSDKMSNKPKFLARVGKITPWTINRNKVQILQKTLEKISNKKFTPKDAPTESSAPATTATPKRGECPLEIIIGCNTYNQLKSYPNIIVYLQDKKTNYIRQVIFLSPSLQEFY